MEEIKFNSPSIALGKKHTTNFKDKETDHVFKNVWDRFFTSPLSKEDIKKSLEAQRLKLQLSFSFIGQVKTYLKNQISSAKKAIKKLFKSVKIKTQKVILSTQLSLNF